jgi:hypothetical protein
MEKIFIICLKIVLLWPGFGMLFLSILNFLEVQNLGLKFACVLLFFISLSYIYLVLGLIKNEIDKDSY